MNLNETSLDMLNGIKDGLSEDEICKKIAEIYDIDEAIARRKIRKLYTRFKREGCCGINPHLPMNRKKELILLHSLLGLLVLPCMFVSCTNDNLDAGRYVPAPGELQVTAKMSSNEGATRAVYLHGHIDGQKYFLDGSEFGVSVVDATDGSAYAVVSRIRTLWSMEPELMVIMINILLLSTEIQMR